jgi:hypothetical protein
VTPAAALALALISSPLPLSGQSREAELYGTYGGDPMYSVLPPGSIPAIVEPEFVSGADANGQMSPHEPVLGVIVNGEALDGVMKGRRLEIIPSVQTTWNRWTLEHPEAKLLEKDEEIRSSRYQGYFDDPDRTGMFRANWLRDRMPGKELVHGITRGPHAIAVSDFGLGPSDTLGVDLGGEAITVIRGPDGGVRAYLKETSEEIPVRPAYWFAWSSFYPNTLVAD